jgi:hypothetical protein
MKKIALIIAACVISTMTFAQDFSTMSDEIDVNFLLNSAESMSDEIDIVIPFDPLEAENGGDNSVELPPYSLNSASYVETGPGAVMAFMLIALLGTALYSYKVRTQKD